MEGLQPQQVRTLLHWLKEGPLGAIPVARSQRSQGSLRAVTWEDAGDPDAIERLGRWHESAFSVFAVTVPVTSPSARQWLIEQVLEAPERVLFWVRAVDGEPVGHIGLSRFNYDSRTVALRDVICGVQGTERLVAEAIESLRTWVQESLQFDLVDAGQHFAAAA
jgi:RimJ/RimL family protein N-acetyltransferase